MNSSDQLSLKPFRMCIKFGWLKMVLLLYSCMQEAELEIELKHGLMNLYLTIVKGPHKGVMLQSIQKVAGEKIDTCGTTYQSLLGPFDQ